MKQPLISIITVVFNGASTLEHTFASVFSQDFDDFEYIVVDGGSKDDTIEIIKNSESKLACWVSETDNGVYDAMNKAVRLTKGRWIYFLGADDYLLCKLEKIAEFLKNDQIIYYGDVYRPAINRRYDGHFTPYKLACRNICQQSIFYPRAIFDKYIFNLKYPILSDHEFNKRCFSDPKITMKYVPLTIAVFNDEGGLSSSAEDHAFESDRMKLIKENFPYYVYIMSLVRFSIIKCLTRLKLANLITYLYHTSLRLKQRKSRK